MRTLRRTWKRYSAIHRRRPLRAAPALYAGITGRSWVRCGTRSAAVCETPWNCPTFRRALNSPAYLLGGMKSDDAAARAARCGVEVLSLDRFVLRRDIQGSGRVRRVYDAEIRKAVIALAQAFEK